MFLFLKFLLAHILGDFVFLSSVLSRHKNSDHFTEEEETSSLSLFLSLFFDGFALPSSYHHHPTAFKCYDLMTVLHLFGSIVDSLRRRE